MIRSSQPPEMRVQGANLRTWIKGNNLESEFTVNKNCRLLPVPGSMTAANVLASNERDQNARSNQGPFGNPGYPPVPPSSVNHHPYPGNASSNYNPVYGPPRPPPPNFPLGPPSSSKLCCCSSTKTLLTKFRTVYVRSQLGQIAPWSARWFHANHPGSPEYFWLDSTQH